MNDTELTEAVEGRWQATLHPFAPMDTLDCWAERERQIVALIERKTRNHERTAYPTSYVDLRKWLALIDAEHATDLPAFLVVGWSCGTWGYVRPTIGVPVTTSIRTPGPNSVSLNRGVARPVVEVPIEAFTIGGRV